jgi:EAL and modified HD-GYP domain-containing signal transduction protein
MRTAVVRLMNLLKTDAELGEIDEEFRKDPVLSYRLLRFVNSAANGFLKEIKSYRQAITILGYQQLHQWMVVMLVTSDASLSRPEVIKSALVRGRFLELVGKAHFSREQSDDMFMVGVFSRLDEILGVPMEEAIAPLSVTEAVRAALIDREGFHGHVLRLAEALEAADEMVVDTWIATNVIDLQVVYDSYTAAIDWVEKLPL